MRPDRRAVPRLCLPALLLAGTMPPARSAGGVNGFSLRSFNVQHTIPRGGSPVVIDLTPPAAGRFPFLCSDYCGAGHDDMRGTLVVRASTAPESDE